MSIKHWDHEIDDLHGQVRAAMISYRKSRATEDRPLMIKKMSIIQHQINIDMYMERIQRLTKQNDLLLPREKTLLHFARELVTRMAGYLDLINKLSTRRLWIKLISTRLGTSTVSVDQLAPEDTVDLAVRHSELLKTEKLLEQSLIEMNQTQKSFIQRYKSLSVAKSNLFASNSAADLHGNSIEDAMADPSVKALNHFMAHATGPVRHQVGETKLAQTTQEYSAKTTNLMQNCRNLVLEGLRKPSSRPRPNRLDRIKEDLKELEILESDTRKAFLDIRRNK
jgi:hypothetical protein